MSKHDTVRPMTPGQLKDIISTLINAVPTKYLTFEMARRILGQKTDFIKRVRDVFKQFSGPFDADTHIWGDYVVSWLYEDQGSGTEWKKIRKGLSLEEVMRLLDTQVFGKRYFCRGPHEFFKVKDDLTWLSYDFPLVIFIKEGNRCFFLFKGESEEKKHTHPGFIFPKECRFVSFQH